MTTKKNDGYYMQIAIDLAKSAWGKTHNNPMVGSLIVHQGAIISKGFHEKSGSDHAEINALKAFNETPDDTTLLYITLEPCSTSGRTGACTEAIIRSGIQKVVIGALDPNPNHAGRGISLLEEEGISVTFGVLEEQCRDLNLIFNHWIVHKKTFSALKVAMTLDGSLAASNGQSKWITSEEARSDVMTWRRLYPAILVTQKTIDQDNPRLTSRSSEAVFCPRRFVLNRSLKSLDQYMKYSVFSDEYKHKTTVVYGELASEEAVQKLKALGIDAWQIKESDHGIDMNDFFNRCAEENLCGIFIEAGAQFGTHLLEKKLVDYLYVYQAPKLLLDSDARALGTCRKTSHIDESLQMEGVIHKTFKEDHLVRGFIKKESL
ncbi:MAG: bifunctional diaminohydroxyphosphoribosylaminopyrimidine deaminase/5-amino-6-(5-phosphoribosylamino)uracil reductase RibD [Coraliomargaritaceae bacterium]